MGTLPEKFEDWRLPWTEEDFDADKAARLVFNARKGEEKAKADVKERDEKITTLTGELDDEKARKSGTDEEAQQELKDLRAKVRKFEEAGTEPRPEDQKQINQLTVALELGLSKADAKRLVGDDYDSILEDGKTFAKDHGLLDDDDDDEFDENGNPIDDGENDSKPPVSQPLRTGARGRGSAHTPSDPAAAQKDLPPLFQ